MAHAVLIESIEQQAEYASRLERECSSLRHKAEEVFFAVEKHPDVKAWRDAIGVERSAFESLARAYVAALQQGADPLVLHQTLQDADVFERVRPKILGLIFPSPPIR